jgi:coenzyme F420-reducing hydrogenase delta subunit
MSEAFEPEILVLYCRKALGSEDYLPEGTRREAGYRARFIMMPCSSKIETGYLVKLVEQGADGVVLVACPPKHCQFLVGSARVGHRVKHARTLLEEAGMGASRVGVVYRQGLSSEDMAVLAEESARAIEPLGQNPMRSAKE